MSLCIDGHAREIPCCHRTIHTEGLPVSHCFLTSNAPATAQLRGKERSSVIVDGSQRADRFRRREGAIRFGRAQWCYRPTPVGQAAEKQPLTRGEADFVRCLPPTFEGGWTHGIFLTNSASGVGRRARLLVAQGARRRGEQLSGDRLGLCHSVHRVGKRRRIPVREAERRRADDRSRHRLGGERHRAEGRATGPDQVAAVGSRCRLRCRHRQPRRLAVRIVGEPGDEDRVALVRHVDAPAGLGTPGTHHKSWKFVAAAKSGAAP